jgi:glycosyltransferase involved in cell wall biosynthesis
VNKDTKQLLKGAHGVRLEQFLDCGLAPEYIPTDLPRRRVSDEFTFLWAGRLEPHKALTLALQALARVEDVRVNLLVAGAGYMRARLEKQVNRLHLQKRVKFLGFIPYQNMPALFRSCDAFLFTSLRDSFGAVVLEAMAYGLPTLTLDHQGVGDFIPSDAGIKVPVTVPEDTINALAQGIRRLATSHRQREIMSVAAWNFAKEQAWDLRAERMSQIYEEVLSAQTRRSSAIRQLEELRQI